MCIILSNDMKRALQWQTWIGSTGSVSTFNHKVHLFTTDFPDLTAVTLSDLQGAEASFDGYSAQNLTGATDFGIVAGSEAQIGFDNVSWTVASTSGSDVVYGYWVDGDNAGSTTAALFAESFPAGIAMDTAGQMLAFTPLVDLDQIPC